MPGKTSFVTCSLMVLLAAMPSHAQLNEKRAVAGPVQQAACISSLEILSLKKHELPVWKIERAVAFTSGMTIDADGAPNAYGPHNRGLDYTANARGQHGWVALVTNRRGQPAVQQRGRYRGYYVSTTSFEYTAIQDLKNPKRYVDATRVPYIALPAEFARRFGIRLGDLAMVHNDRNGRTSWAIFADVGPAGKIGEGSIALAQALGIPSNPRHDSQPAGITYLVFPGSAASEKRVASPQHNRSSAEKLFRGWGGDSRLRSCSLW